MWAKTFFERKRRGRGLFLKGKRGAKSFFFIVKPKPRKTFFGQKIIILEKVDSQVFIVPTKSHRLVFMSEEDLNLWRIRKGGQDFFLYKKGGEEFLFEVYRGAQTFIGGEKGAKSFFGEKKGG